jgi:hypothetical protein
VTPNLAGSRASAFSGREGYFLGVLLLINTINYLDRQVINILAEPIRLDLKLNDWQLGAVATLRELASSKSFPLITVVSATGGLVNFVHSAFFAAFMLRVHPEELKQLASTFGGVMGITTPVGFVGIALGLTTGIMGIIGTLLGGWLADTMAKRGGYGVYMIIPAVAKLVSLPIAVAALLAPNVMAALLLVCVLNVIRSAAHGPALSSVYALVRPEIRPTTSAILVFVIAVLGLGIGPIAVGLLSDTISASGWGAADGLRIALICAESVGLIGAILFLIARPIYIREAKY